MDRTCNLGLKLRAMKKYCLGLLGLVLIAAFGCGPAENVKNDRPLTEEDKRYLKEMDDKVADEEKAGGG